jgi:hypothetical protein
MVSLDGRDRVRVLVGRRWRSTLHVHRLIGVAALACTIYSHARRERAYVAERLYYLRSSSRSGFEGGIGTSPTASGAPTSHWHIR